MSDVEGDGRRGTAAAELLGGGETSLLEAVDGLLNKGVLLEGDLVLGLADVDLVYLRLTTLLAAADRILGNRRPAPPPTPGGDPSDSLRSLRAGERRPGPPREATGPNVQAELAAARADTTPAAPEAPDTDTGPVDALRHELESTLGARAADDEGTDEADAPPPPRWNAEPDDVERSVARLVLALVDFLRQLMERQAIRRMEEGTLTEDQVERLGRALMRLEETVHDMARRFGLRPEELNLDLGPLGRLT